MAQDLSKMSDAELEAIANGSPDLSKMTDAQLEALANGQELPQKYSAEDITRINGMERGGRNYVPEWGQKHPNLYAGTMAGLDTLPALASLAKSAGVGVLLGGLINPAAQSAKRAIQGEPTDGFTLLKDIAKGATVEGAGRLGGAVLTKGLNDLPNLLTKSAAKLSTGLTPSEQTAIADTLLKYDTPFTEEGGRKLESVLSANAAKKAALLQAAEDRGLVFKNADIVNTITDPNAPIGGSLAALMKYGKQVEPSVPGYVDDLINTVKQFAKGGDMTPTTLVANQRAKGDLLKKAWGDNTINDASSQANKQLYANMGKVINDSIDGVAPLNAESSAILDALPYFNKSINRIGNRDVVGLSEKLAMGSIGAPAQFAETPSTHWAKFVAYALDRPEIKSKVARGIHKAASANIAGKSVGTIANKASLPLRAAIEGAVLGGSNYGN